MILTEEISSIYLDLRAKYWDVGKLSFARAIEQYIMDRLQNKLKNAERYEWLRMQYTEVELIDNAGQAVFIESFVTSEEDANYLDNVIDSAMVATKDVTDLVVELDKSEV